MAISRSSAPLYEAGLGRIIRAKIGAQNAAVVGEAPDPGGTWPIDERVSMIINQCSERCERLLPMWTFVETLQRRATETAQLVAGHAPITLEVTKEAVRRIRRTLSRDEGEDLILKAYMSEDFREGMDAFLNKRAPNFSGG